MRDAKLYVGMTKDIAARFNQHNQGRVLSTKARIPLEIIYEEKLEITFNHDKLWLEEALINIIKRNGK